MNKNITLVLSGGGARGIAHIGVIEELESKGYNIKSIAGTSMGALIGGVYAQGKLQELKDWLYTMHKRNLFRLIDFSFSNHGLIKGDKVIKILEQFIPDDEIENLGIRFTATAFDLVNNKEIVFSKGSLFKAIRASISIPTVFTPVVDGDSLLVDGGVANNIPINHAIRTPGDWLVAVHVNADTPLPVLPVPEHIQQKRKSEYLHKLEQFKKDIISLNPDKHEKKMGYFHLINTTISSMINHASWHIIHEHPPDMLINISRDVAGIFDFYKAEELVETGRYITAEALSRGKA